MADSVVALEWTGTGLEFTGGAPNGPEVLLDGNGRAGVSPVTTLLLALAACTGSDVVEIVQKMRVPIDSLAVTVEGGRMPEPPRRFHTLRLLYRAGGVSEADRDKVRRALTLSREKYCSVLHTLRTDLVVSFELEFA